MASNLDSCLNYLRYILYIRLNNHKITSIYLREESLNLFSFIRGLPYNRTFIRKDNIFKAVLRTKVGYRLAKRRSVRPLHFEPKIVSVYETYACKGRIALKFGKLCRDSDFYIHLREALYSFITGFCE